MRGLLTGLALICCVHTTLVATQADVYREARTHFERGEYLLAMLAAQRAVQQDGKNAEYRYLYGAILLELKQYSEAERNLRQAVASEPRRAEFQYSLGELLLAKKNEAAIRKESRSGVGQPRMKNVDQEGVQALEQAVELAPDLLKARLRLGQAYYDLNRHDLALEQFEAVARKDPAYPWIHSSMAVVHINSGSVDAAVEALERELRYHPDHHSSRLELGEALLKAGDSPQALQHLLQLREADVSPADRVALNHALSKSHRDLGRHEEAVTFALRTLELDPSFPDGHYILAQLYAQTGRTELARRQMEIFRKVKREKQQETLGTLRRGR